MGNVSKYFLDDDMKKTGLYRYVYDFSVDYDSIDVADVLDIWKDLMVENNKKVFCVIEFYKIFSS